MSIIPKRRAVFSIAILGALAAVSLQAAAHHGWSWAEGEQTELKGTIQSISMAPPHPALTVAADDGTLWQVDLGNPSQTERSGFRSDTAAPGDAITIIGNRNKDPDRSHMKAVRITIDGRHYDMYPERLGED